MVVGPFVLLWCTTLYYLFINYNNIQYEPEQTRNTFQRIDQPSKFEVRYEWSYLNYTWESIPQYQQAIRTGKYIPANNAPTGMKFYQNKMFLSVPRFRPGIPATLVSLDMNDNFNHVNPLLTPYPNWQYNDDSTSCLNLQSIQSMEIDTRGTMWIIDGVRINDYTRCPTKLVLLDLNNGGSVIHTYIFPIWISRQNGGFLNDIVVDETGGDFAYITDNSQNDPGIIVYSRKKKQSWKLRDQTMHPEPNAVSFPVENIIFNNSAPVDGIALSPKRSNGRKTVFYCAISSFSIYSISTSVIKNRRLVKSGGWRNSIQFVGRKSAQSDGIIIDDEGNMYLTMLPENGVASWNINQPFSSISMVDMNSETMVWPDGFAFDQQGHLYLISNKVFNYIDPNSTPEITDNSVFRVLRSFTGTRSYLYG